MIIIIINQ